MNNIKKVLIVVLLAILSLLIIIFNNKSNNDTLLIKKEYEKLNNLVDLNGNKYYEVSISKYANIDIVDLKEVKDILKSKTGVIYFGDSKSLNSRIAIEVLLNAKENTGLETLFYYDMSDNNEDVLKLLEKNDISSDTLPIVLFVKDGKINFFKCGIYEELGEDEKSVYSEEKLEKIYTENIVDIMNNLCDIDKEEAC